MSFIKSKLAMAVAAGMALSPAAFATNGILPAGNGMVAHGFGGAGLSNAGEAAAGMDNPALISQTGNSVGMAFSIFMPDREVDTRNATIDPSNDTGGGPYTTLGALNVSDSKMYAIPQMAFTSQASKSVSWGIMAYAMGGMSTDYRSGPFPGTSVFPGDNSFGVPNTHATDPQSVSLSGMIIAPTLSYAINKDMAVGASLIVGYEVLTMRNLFGAGATGTGEGSAVGYGVKLGINANVAPGISVGAMVQPKLSMDEISVFKTFITEASRDLQTPFAIRFKGDAALTLPNQVGVGAKFAIGKSVDIVADVLYYQWTSVDVFEFFGWEDQVVYKAGAEFRPSESLALRVGFNYGESPIQGGNRTGSGSSDVAFANFAFPAISETHYTVGLGYKMDKNLAINGYYLYSPEATQTATGNSSKDQFDVGADGVGPGTVIRMTQHAFGIGINYSAK